MPEKEKKLTKVLSDKISRTFNLIFNQVSMYYAEHPAAERSIDQFYQSLVQGLKIKDTILLIMNREQFFIDEEPFDQRINTDRMVAYFKKAEISSIYFERGLKMPDLQVFVKVFFDNKTYPTADAMIKAFADTKLEPIKINYVFFKKMTSDDEVVSKDQLLADPEAKEADGRTSDDASKDEDAGPSTEDILEMIAANVLFEEFENTMTVQNLVNSPADMSRQMVEADLTSSEQMADQGQKPGHALYYQLQQFRQQVDATVAEKSDLSLPNLAKGVFDLRNRLLEDIEAQKAKGVVYVFEDQIRNEVDEITDDVMIRLVTEEYHKGEISVKRLAQILLRLIPETKELQRLLPKLKKALLAEGMPLSDFLTLIQELKHELQSDELSRILEQNADKIGLDPEDLISEIMKNPKDTAELISIAAEIRKGTGDDQALSNVLVDYVEKVGTEMALEEAGKDPESDGAKIHNILDSIRSKIIGKLKEKNIDSGILENVESRLVEKMEESVRKIQTSMIFNQINTDEGGAITRDTILKILSEQSDDDDALRMVLDEVRQSLLSRGVDEAKFQGVFDEILGTHKDDVKRQEREKKKGKTPRGTLSQGNTLYILNNEVLRSIRYKTPFSTLSFSIFKVTPKKPPGDIKVTWDDVIEAFMRNLAETVRETDMVGRIGSKIIIVIQPMTDGAQSKLARSRINNKLRVQEYIIKDIPFEMSFANTATPFDPENAKDLNAYLTAIRNELMDLQTRLSSIQELF
jgi:hypothetical protein